MLTMTENKALIAALVAFVRTSFPDIDYDDSGIADPANFPISVISGVVISQGENGTRASFNVDHWSLAENHSADDLQTRCDGILSAINKKVIVFDTSNIFLVWFDNEVTEAEAPDYIHKVQSFSGNIYYGG